MRKIFFDKKIKILFFSIIIVVVVSFSAQKIFAVWSGTYYNPGDTLNPECLPTDSECDVLIFPSQTGNSGKYLTTNGTTTSWATVPSGGISNIVEDTTPQLGGDLDLNGNVITGLVVGTNVQAYDADLTTYAGITPSSNVQTLLGSADYSAFRTSLGLVIGTNVQAYDADLTTYAGITPSSNVQTLLGSADYSAFRTSLGLVIGTNVQAYDADLTTYAGITPSSNVQTLLGSADYSAFRTSLGLVIGTNVQAYDADLTTYAGITPSSNVQTLLGSADYSAFRTSLGLVIGTNVQAYDAKLENFVSSNLALASNTFSSSSGAITITPSSGSNLNVSLATTGDFVVNTDDLYVDTSSGYVGIGTTSPTKILSVNGDALINTLNIGIGNGSISTNSVFGYQALNANTTGYRNVAVGYQSMASNQDGYMNTAMGYQSLNTNTSGYENIAIGTFALSSNTSGYRNVGIGKSALTSVTSGNHNTAIGYGSLISLTSGLYNTSVGAESAEDISSGRYNSAFGNRALYSNTTSYYNTAIGYGSLYNTTGEKNSGLGYLSLYSNTSGVQNVALGDSALYGNTTGSYNIALGINAGRYLSNGSSANETGTYNIYIGYNSKSDSSSRTNEIVIGYNAIGAGSDSVVLGNDSITKTILKGNIGIGTTGPDRKFDVLDTSAPQMRLSYTDGSVYTDFQTNSGGNLVVTHTGDYVRLNSRYLVIGSDLNASFGPTDNNNTFTVGGANLMFSSSGTNASYAFNIYNGSRTPTSGEAGLFNPSTNAGFAPTSGTATWVGFKMAPTINQTGGASGITRGIYVNPTLTAAADWRSIDIASNSGYGIYQSGASAKNYFAGDIGIGTTNPGQALDVIDNISSSYAVSIHNDGDDADRYGLRIAAGQDNGSGTLIQFHDGNGSDVGEITFSGTTTTYGTSSDLRMKKDIVDTSYTLEDLLDIKVHDFKFIEENSDKVYTGFIAQELIEIFPDAVFSPNDGRMWSVDYGKITPVIVKAVQDLNLKFENLENFEDTSNVFVNKFREWFASLENDISKIYALVIQSEKVETKELCIDDICITRNQLETILQNQGMSGSQDGGSEDDTENNENLDDENNNTEENSDLNGYNGEVDNSDDDTIDDNTPDLDTQNGNNSVSE